MDKVIIYKDAANEWRWRRVANNGNIVSSSGEGYKNHSHCEEMASKLNKDAEIIVAVYASDISGVESVEEAG